jgi:hypothetical protein
MFSTLAKTWCMKEIGQEISFQCLAAVKGINEIEELRSPTF